MIFSHGKLVTSKKCTRSGHACVKWKEDQRRELVGVNCGGNWSRQMPQVQGGASTRGWLLLKRLETIFGNSVAKIDVLLLPQCEREMPRGKQQTSFSIVYGEQLHLCVKMFTCFNCYSEQSGLNCIYCIVHLV